MQRIVINSYVDTMTIGLFIVTLVLFCLRTLVNARQTNHPTAQRRTVCGAGQRARPRTTR
ncbi:MAG TPA: hypothetical protein VJ527_15725 [Rhodanobacter sp.]|nr:hypothetical protein [Rhodanobacter sp.]